MLNAILSSLGCSVRAVSNFLMFTTDVTYFFSIFNGHYMLFFFLWSVNFYCDDWFGCRDIVIF